MELRRTLRNLDWWLILATLMLMTYGLVLIYSATHTFAVETGRSWHMGRQMIFMAVSIIVAAFSLRFDYRMLKNYTKQLYIVNLVLLIVVMLFGHAQLGAQRWIQIGPLSFQPSEFSKIILIICLAAFIEKRLEWLETFKDYLPVFAYVLVPFILVMRQPDLGTSLTFIAILLGMIFISGFKYKWFLRLGVTFLALMPVFWMVLKDYQKNRIRVFLNPELDPFGSGYHVIQSKIAVGSGGLFGKGWLEGTQSQLNFLPENHTDFIFAVAGEEFGFVGTILLILLYLIIIWRGIVIALNADDDFGTLLATGITSMFMFHIMINIGMTIGIMPVTGVPLPFLSYGVSSLLTNVGLIALLLNIKVQDQRLQF